MSQSLCAADVLPKYWPLSHLMRPLRFYSYTPLPPAAGLDREFKVTNDQPSFAPGSMHSRKRKVLRDAWVHDIALIAREEAEDYRQFIDKPFGTLLSMLPWYGCHEQIESARLHQFSHDTTCRLMLQITWPGS